MIKNFIYNQGEPEIRGGGGLVTTIILDHINFDAILFCVSRLNT